jgi:hypothetical protein
MRRLVLASLLLAPLVPAAAFASTTANDVNPAKVNRISTGVIAPQLLESANVVIPQDAYDTILPRQIEVSVNLNVDEKGNAHNVQVLKPFNFDLAQRVVAAVEKFHFRPATLDSQAIPVEMHLTVVVQR